jgi:hypothetical protein
MVSLILDVEEPQGIRVNNADMMRREKLLAPDIDVADADRRDP